MNSGFYDWIYWHSLTITVDYNSSHIELLSDVCLTNLSEESGTCFCFSRNKSQIQSQSVAPSGATDQTFITV
jgi:hypothetical protein